MTGDYQTELRIMVEMTPEELDVFQAVEERIEALRVAKETGPELINAIYNKQILLCAVIHRLFFGALIERLAHDDSGEWWKKL